MVDYHGYGQRFNHYWLTKMTFFAAATNFDNEKMTKLPTINVYKVLVKGTFIRREDGEHVIKAKTEQEALELAFDKFEDEFECFDELDEITTSKCIFIKTEEIPLPRCNKTIDLFK
jgi:hypothetical protein